MATLGARLYGPADPSPFAPRLRLALRLTDATQSHFRDPVVPALLFAALNVILFGGPPPLSAADGAAARSLISAAAAAVWAAGAAPCAPTLALNIAGALPIQISRVPPEGPPPALSIDNVTLHFPPTLGGVLAAGAPTVDLFVGVSPAAGGTIVEAVTVTFAHAQNRTELSISALPEPVSIVWPVRDKGALLQPVGQYYECVFDVCGRLRGPGWTHVDS